MEKEKFYKLLTSFIISLIGMGFLFHLMFDNFSHEVNFNFSESVTQYSSSPKVNDLYIWEDSAVDQKKYFRVSAVSDTIGVIEMVTNSTKQVDESIKRA